MWTRDESLGNFGTKFLLRREDCKIPDRFGLEILLVKLELESGQTRDTSLNDLKGIIRTRSQT